MSEEMESSFDPSTFMNTEVAGEMETTYTPIPAADYSANVDEIDVRQITTDQGNAVVLDVTYLIHAPDLAAEMGMERLTVRQGIFLDIEPNGAIALGANKNVKLGRLREALGQNAPGPWNFQMLVGAGPLTITVSTKPSPKDETVVYNNVDKTLPLAA